ncbi:hypothetical protein QAD02_013623 [Eretmocerus hayati]|uniref:Uncharacterized protein n=1 Tax=Eretmocerus hayati TaxID=131215 RepID=A0ACC2P442_9HYME|nr:hypothetical protein QAD02_013623 [Eretmocerus hayati]
MHNGSKQESAPLNAIISLSIIMEYNLPFLFQQILPATPSPVVRDISVSPHGVVQDPIIGVDASPDSESGQSGIQFGGAQDGLFNGHWDRDAHEQIMTDGETENADDAAVRGTVHANVEHNDQLGGFERLRNFISQDKNNDTVEASVDVNKCEIVLAVLK